MLHKLLRLLRDSAEREIFWRIVFIIIIPISYFVVGLQFYGPAHISDEVGYLTKAVVAAGFPSDSASSWHGGYSLVISPFFRIFDDPFTVWRCVQAFNAVSFGISFWILFKVLRDLEPKNSAKRVGFSVFFASLYPSWVIMSGYSFVTPFFVLLYMVWIRSIQCYLASGSTNKAVVASLISGYLFWVHPSGVVISSISAMLCILAVITRRISILKGIFLVGLIAGMVLVYKYGIHPWFTSVATPDDYTAWSHYGSISKALASLRTMEFWIRLPGLILGQVSYLLIATFGLAAYGVTRVFTDGAILTRLRRDDKKIILSLILTISLVGFILLSALSSASNGSILRVDTWIYGRYIEVVLLPLLGLGLLTVKPTRNMILGSASIVFMGSLVLRLVTPLYTNFNQNNLVNIQAFWPYSLFTHSNMGFGKWFLLGSIGIIIVGYVWRLLGRRVAFVVMIPFYLLAFQSQTDWHNRILLSYSRPSGIYQLVRDNFQKGACIGVDYPSKGDGVGVRSERIRLNSFYLYDYDLGRKSFMDWYNSCSGPYLTYDPSVIPGVYASRVAVIAREETSGLLVIRKKDAKVPLRYEDTNSDNLYVNTDNQDCVVRGCILRSAENLIAMSQVGKLDQDYIITTGRDGYLFFGPNTQLLAGSYELTIMGTIANTESARLEVVTGASTGNPKYYYNKQLSSLSPLRFVVGETAKDLEVRLYVTNDSAVRVRGYSLTAIK